MFIRKIFRKILIFLVNANNLVFVNISLTTPVLSSSSHQKMSITQKNGKIRTEYRVFNPT